MEFIIKPLEGIQWSGRTLLLGCSRSDVESALGGPQVIRNSFYYFDNELRFDFDANGALTFIEFLGGIDGRIHPYIYGCDAFGSDAEKVYHILEEQNSGKIIDNEKGYSYGFCDLSVGLYREATPDSVAEMIEDMKSFGVDIDNNEDLMIERKKARHWATIGLGCKGYYGE